MSFHDPHTCRAHGTVISGAAERSRRSGRALSAQYQKCTERGLERRGASDPKTEALKVRYGRTRALVRNPAWPGAEFRQTSPLDLRDTTSERRFLPEGERSAQEHPLVRLLPFAICAGIRHAGAAGEIPL